MNLSEIIFIGVKGHVVALNRRDGVEVWRTKLKPGILASGDRFVTLLVDGDRLFAHTYGELYCLDAITGEQLWNNELNGLSFDIASLATCNGATAPTSIQKRRQEEAARHEGA